MKPIPAMHLDPDPILAAALRTADEHGVPVKALACADVPERTLYRWMSDPRPHASFAGGVAVIRRMPEEMQVAAVRQLFPDIHVTLQASHIVPARNLMSGMCAVVSDAAAALESAQHALADDRTTPDEEAQINADLDRLVMHVEAIRAALPSRKRKTATPLSLARTSP